MMNRHASRRPPPPFTPSYLSKCNSTRQLLPLRLLTLCCRNIPFDGYLIILHQYWVEVQWHCTHGLSLGGWESRKPQNRFKFPHDTGSLMYEQSITISCWSWSKSGVELCRAKARISSSQARISSRWVNNGDIFMHTHPSKFL